MKKLLLIPLLCLGLVGCNEPTPSIKGKEFTVGTLSNGKTLKCVKIDRESSSAHYAYFVEDTVTVNYSVQQGKSTRNETIVLINGVEYQPVIKPEK